MNHSASATLRWLYCLTIVGAVLPLGISGWVAMTVGSSPLQSVPFIGPIVFLAIGIWRVYLVARFPRTLDSFVYDGLQKVLRVLGSIGMIFGAVYLVLILVYRPIVRAIVTTPSESGAEFYVVGVFLALVSGIGPMGIVMFELSRLLGFERYHQDAD